MYQGTLRMWLEGESPFALLFMGTWANGETETLSDENVCRG